MITNRKPCPHGVVLDRGLKCDHGYLQVRLDTIEVCRNFGPHTPDAEEVAKIYLAEQRKRILLGKAGIVLEDPQIKFARAAEIEQAFWADERDDDGKLKHSEENVIARWGIIEASLLPYFGDKYFDESTTADVENWRETLIEERGISGTTVNRYQGVLSGIYTNLSELHKRKKIKRPFRVPKENPVEAASWAEMKKRERIASDYELRKLKMAFLGEACSDADGWEICKLTLTSTLSLADLGALEAGDVIDIQRSKTGVDIDLPIVVEKPLDFTNWRKRWNKARSAAGLKDLQFRDLRKTGINALTGLGFDQKLVSQYAGHASTKTTESIYQLRRVEKLKPLAEAQKTWVEGL